RRRRSSSTPAEASCGLSCGSDPPASARAGGTSRPWPGARRRTGRRPGSGTGRGPPQARPATTPPPAPPPAAPAPAGVAGEDPGAPRPLREQGEVAVARGEADVADDERRRAARVL